MNVKESKLNKNKIKIMVISRNKNSSLLDLKMKRIQIKEVKEDI